ncbi:MAG: hypothetical protein E6K72_03135 [Candidatus Eisenbacteria bacterium]|uniref:SGNH hydrolase-type esterase domain-containing protein n=1 Tax=Eiseniibacteriota bacterium TaxID=2212470 RepID=A0A538T2U5_UNCEI|nr:MAG: hypothetical protein E6K72_03135 [Candidatus Eisenbacteria bacterium]
MSTPLSRLRAFAANLTVLLIGIVTAALLLEVALRVHNPFQARIKGDRIVLTANARGHYRYAATLPGLDREITISSNALGFRGPNPPARFAEHLTLVAIGGSTTRCALQPDDKTWTAHLGRLLGRSFRDVWINNAGLDGHSTFGHRVLLEDCIVRLHPKVALFLVGVNDVVAGANNERDAENIRGPLRLGSLKAPLRSLCAHSEAAAMILDLYRSAVAQWGGLGYHPVDLAALGEYQATPEQERAHREAFAGPDRLADYAERLERLIEDARAAAIEPVFVTQPLLVGRGMDDVTGRNLATIAVVRHGNGKMLWGVLEAYNDVTRRVCRENGVLLIDLARDMPKSSRYFADFMHFNNDGTALVAEWIDRSLCPHLARRYPTYVTDPCPGSALLHDRAGDARRPPDGAEP